MSVNKSSITGAFFKYERKSKEMNRANTLKVNKYIKNGNGNINNVIKH